MSQHIPEDKDSQPKSPGMCEEIKADILASIREEISKIIREKMRSALSEEFTTLGANINAARAEIARDATAIRVEMTTI